MELSAAVFVGQLVMLSFMTYTTLIQFTGIEVTTRLLTTSSGTESRVDTTNELSRPAANDG
jgi:hypothetical protein